MTAATILCERVLSDMLAADEGLADQLHEPAEHMRGTLQTYAVRISLAVNSGDQDTAYIPCEEHEGVTLGTSLAKLATDKWGIETGHAVADMIRFERERVRGEWA